jgi:hypothetical protein
MSGLSAYFDSKAPNQGQVPNAGDAGAPQAGAGPQLGAAATPTPYVDAVTYADPADRAQRLYGPDAPAAPPAEPEVTYNNTEPQVDHGLLGSALSALPNKIQEMRAAGATPAEQLKPHVEQLIQSHTKNFLPEEYAQFKQDVGNYLAQPVAPDGSPSPAAAKVENGAKENIRKELQTSQPTPETPQQFGEQRGMLAQMFEQFNALPTEAKAAVYIGLPLALVAMLSGGDDEGGGFGLGGMLMGALGLGAVGAGMAGAGMFGQDAQNSMADALTGIGQSAGFIPEETHARPAGVRILTAEDPDRRSKPAAATSRGSKPGQNRKPQRRRRAAAEIPSDARRHARARV